MKPSLSLVLVLCTAGLLNAQTHPKRVILTGTVTGSTDSTPKVMGINFLNPFHKTRESVTLLEGQTFSIQQDMIFTQNMTVSYNNTFINLYVAPGDSVHLSINAALLDRSNFEWLTISGDHAALSTQLNLIHNYLSKLPRKKYNYAWSVPEMMQEVQKDYNRYLTAINNYKEQHPVDPVVVEFSKRDSKYGISSWISDYVNQGKDSSSTKTDRLKMFKDSFFENHNPENFVSMMYPYHLSNCAYWLTREDPKTAKAIKEERYQEAIVLGADLLLEEPQGLSRDYMLFNYISNFSNKNPTLLSENPKIRSYFSQSASYNYLELAAEDVDLVRAPLTIMSGLRNLSPEGIVSVVPKADLQQILAKKHPGKVIYIDVYATWCLPCLEEMKYAPVAQQHFVDKDVVFVNLCLLSTEATWKKLIKNKDLKGDHYLLDEDASKLVMGNYNMDGVPTYMLMDKKGKLISTKAPKPSDLKNLSQAIEKLL